MHNTTVRESVSIMSTLPSLPTEILHRIFDYFDTKTLFQSVKLTYNRIKIEQCAKKNLVRVCTNVSPEHIIYLSCNEDYSVPDSFFSNLQQMTNLQYLSVNVSFQTVELLNYIYGIIWNGIPKLDLLTIVQFNSLYWYNIYH